MEIIFNIKENNEHNWFLTDKGVRNKHPHSRSNCFDAIKNRLIHKRFYNLKDCKEFDIVIRPK